MSVGGFQVAERIHLAEQIHLWRTRSRLNCLWRTLILCNVESGNFRMTNLWNLADWQLDGNVEASERIKPSTCPFFYLLINQWSEETPFLSSLRMNQGYLFSLKVKLRPTLPTVNCLALAYSRQQVPFSPAIGQIYGFAQEVRTVFQSFAFWTGQILPAGSIFLNLMSWHLTRSI